MNCVECHSEVEKNAGTEENPLCEGCYNKMRAEYSDDQANSKEFPKTKPGVNTMMFIGLFVCILGTLCMFQIRDYGAWIGIGGAVMTGVCLIGLIISSVDSSKTGPMLVIIGCAPFVPLGMIGVIGAQKAIREAQETDGRLSRASSRPRPDSARFDNL
jgi:hypothetical protein